MPDQTERRLAAIVMADVVGSSGYIQRDGVNVVARLQGEADPGGVCISDAVYVRINGKIDKAALAAEEFRKASAARSDVARYAMYHARICQLPEDKESWVSGCRMAGLPD